MPALTIVHAPEGTLRNDLTPYVVRTDTDVWWTATAGDPFSGESFSQRGVHLLLMKHGNAPVAGVEVSNGQVFYFADTDLAVRSTVDPDATATGVDGAALRVDSTIGAEVTGGEPPGCAWSPLPFGTIPGYVWVETSLAVTSMPPDDICP